MPVNINPQRLLTDLRKLRSFGAEGGGVIRPTFSSADISSRKWLAEKFEQASLLAEIDGVGNVFGWSGNPGKALLTGSHSDTQPEGGWLDGALGVIYALEIARALSECEETKSYAVNVVSWSDEEGCYFSSLGSLSFCRKLKEQQIENARSAEGKSLVHAIREAGLSDVKRRHLDVEHCLGYLEAHIEQGPRLESEQKLIGVVSSIVGIRECKIEFLGEQNHAGTTPMHLRRDAVTAMLACCQQISEAFTKLADKATVWTFGVIDVHPNAASIVPDRVNLTIQFRDPDNSLLDEMSAMVSSIAKKFSDTSDVRVTAIESEDKHLPAQMDDNFQDAIRSAAEIYAPGKWIDMPSGAGHDAQVLAEYVPTAMLFIPSIGGISHSFAENSSDQDIILGCQVAATAAAQILHNYHMQNR